MHDNQTALERAFQLAKSGRYASVEHILKTLKTEGYLRDQTDGPLLRRQLKGLYPFHAGIAGSHWDLGVRS